MTPPSDPPSIGELNRNMVRLTGELDRFRAELHSLQDLRATARVHGHRLDELDEQLDDVQGSLAWVVRLVVAAVVLALLSLVVKATGAG